jgi:hypothetical protein
LSYQRELSRALARFDTLYSTIAPLALAAVATADGLEKVRAATAVADDLRALAALSPGDALRMDANAIAQFNFARFIPGARDINVRDEMENHSRDNVLYRRAVEDLSQVVDALESGRPTAVALDFRKILSAVRSATLVARGVHTRFLDCLNPAELRYSYDLTRRCSGLEALDVAATLSAERIAWAGAVVFMASLWRGTADAKLFIRLARQALSAVKGANYYTPWSTLAQGVYVLFRSYARDNLDGARLAFSGEALLGRAGIAGSLMTAFFSPTLPNAVLSTLPAAADYPEGLVHVSPDQNGAPHGLLLRRGISLRRADGLPWTVVGFAQADAVILRSEFGAVHVATLPELESLSVLGSILLR